MWTFGLLCSLSKFYFCTCSFPLRVVYFSKTLLQLFVMKKHNWLEKESAILKSHCYSQVIFKSWLGRNIWQWWCIKLSFFRHMLHKVVSQLATISKQFVTSSSCTRELAPECKTTHCILYWECLIMKRKKCSWTKQCAFDVVDLHSQTGTLSKTAVDHFQTRLHDFKRSSCWIVFAKSIYLLLLLRPLILYISLNLYKNMKKTS